MIACLGSPMMDLIVHINQDFLLKYNLQSDSAYVARDDKLFQSLQSPVQTIGGSITNTARIINWIDQEVVYIGAIGDDTHGIYLEQALISEGINCRFKHLDGPTAKCAVLVENSKRTLYTDLGVSGSFTLNHMFEPHIWKSLNGCKYIYLSAFFIGVSYPCIQEILKLSKYEKKMLAFNLGAAFLCDKFPQQVQDVIAQTNLLFGNEMELFAFGASLGVQGDLKQVALFVDGYRNPSKRTMVITRGEKSALLVTAGKIQEFPVINVPIVDSNGAGDAFAGGFIAALMKGCELDVCMRCGLWAASEVIQNTGCSFDKNKRFQFD